MHLNIKNSITILIIIWFLDQIDGVIEVLDSLDKYPDRMSEFGMKIPTSGVEGVLVPIDSIYQMATNGCQRPSQEEINNARKINGPWIGMVERGGCSFVRKTRNMQELGAIGVIIGDNENGGLITMRASEDASDIRIPSVFVMQWEYRELKYKVEESIDDFKEKLILKFRVKVLPDEFIDWPIFDIILVTIVAPGLVISFLFALWRWKFGDEDYGGGNESVFDPQNFPGYIPITTNLQDQPASPEMVNNLARKTYSTKDRLENDPDICAVCLDDFEDGDSLRKLPCKHEFHITCIDPWLLTRKRFCPVCKGDVCPQRPPIGATSQFPLGPSLDTRSIILETEPLLPSSTSSITIPFQPEAPIPPNPLQVGIFRTLNSFFRSTTSIFSAATSQSAPPFPVADPDDYENARRLALSNRRIQLNNRSSSPRSFN